MSWLFAQLRHAGTDGITYDDLVKSLPSDSPMVVLWNKRTFHHYQSDLKKWFGVEIECTRPKYRYRLKEPKTENVPWTMPYIWAVESSAAIKFIRDIPEYEQYIFVDNSPSGGDLVRPILEAIKQQKRIEFYYVAPGETRPLLYPEVNPYWLWMKDYKWYLLGTLPSYSLIKYPLSNMSKIRVTDNPCRRAPVSSPRLFIDEYERQERKRIQRNGRIV